jgi:3'-5' exoribonuclease
MQVIDYKQKLNDLAQEVLNDPELLDIALKVINNKEFNEWTASCNSHHWGHGGLVRHTYEVCSLCLINNVALNSSFIEVDERALFLAALFHDFGKVQDYEYVEETQEWRATEHKFEIHHISTSLLEFDRAFTKVEEKLLKDNVITKEFGDSIRHAILSHHGRREWGSPVNPRTKIAWLLHLCDSLSARMDDLGQKKHESKNSYKT